MRPRNLRSVLCSLCIIGLLFALGCGRGSPTAPGRSISGPLVLVGYLTDTTGRFVGTRVVADASGVPVQLVTASGVVATTTTVNGRYTFDDPPPGSYRARASVTIDLLDETRPLTVTDGPVLVADTLRLQSRGDLYPVPNPFVSSLVATFAIASDEQASLRVLDSGGNVVRVLLEGQFPSGLNLMGWNGTDSHGIPVPAGFYWLTLYENAGTRAQLVFRR